ncbi:MAG: hypothetical protein AAGD11_00300 [Planctomycetota bacterium]
MSPETKSLLLRFDEEQAWEFPSNFNARDIENRARKVFSELCEAYGKLVFEDWELHQDASFGLAIAFVSHQVKNSLRTTQPTIRFSNFGNLATYTAKELLPNNAGQDILEALKRYGFMYVDSEDLDEPHDGVMSPNKAVSTWWIRYFDWL